MSDVKERIGQALRDRNYFEIRKKDSMEVFEKATQLGDIIIKVERSCNVDKLYFRYNATTHKFCRVVFTQEDKDLLHQEALYKIPHTCRDRGCFSRKIDVDTFLELLKNAFEPIAVYVVTEFKG